MLATAPRLYHGLSWTMLLAVLLVPVVHAAEPKLEIVVSDQRTDGINSLSVSKHGKQILAGTAENYAVLWDVSKGKPVQKFDGHSKQVAAASLRADGQRAATGSYDKTAILWDAQTGAKLQTLAAHTDWVIAVRLSADGKRILTGSMDGK